jgi:hypothetical protein
MQAPALQALTPEQIQAIAAVLANPPVASSRQIPLAQKAQGFGIRQHKAMVQSGKVDLEIVPIDAVPTMLVAQLFNYSEMVYQQLINTASRMTVPSHKQQIEPVMPLCGSNAPPPTS